MKGAHPCLKSVEALVHTATRKLSVFDDRPELVHLREVVGLDVCDGGVQTRWSCLHATV